MEQEQVTNGVGFYTMEEVDKQARRLNMLKDNLTQKYKGKSNGKKNTMPQKPGLNSLDKGNTIPAARTGREHLSTAPVTKERLQRTPLYQQTPGAGPSVARPGTDNALSGRRNAQAGPSSHRPTPAEVARSRQPLRVDSSQEEDDFIAIPRFEPRRSYSPTKVQTQTYSDTDDDFVEPEEGPRTTHNQRNNGDYPIPRKVATGTLSRTPRARGASASRSASPQKKKARLERPAVLEATPPEEEERIENPDGSFKDPNDSDIEYLQENPMTTRLTRASAQQDNTTSPTKEQPEVVSSTKGKAAARRTNAESSNVETRRERAETLPFVPQTDRSQHIIKSSDLGRCLCATKVALCIDSPTGTKRRMSVRHIELHDDGLELRTSRDPKSTSCFIACRAILEARICERSGCALLICRVSLNEKKAKIDPERLLALVATAASDLGRRPTLASVDNSTLQIPLDGDAAKNFAIAFRNAMTKHFPGGRAQRLTERECREIREIAPLEWPEHSKFKEHHDRAMLPSSPPSRPNGHRGRETKTSNGPEQQMQELVAASKDKGKGRQREVDQSQLTYQPSTSKTPAALNRSALVRTSGRIARRTQVVDDLTSDTEEGVPEPPQAPAPQPPADRGSVLFPYPLTGRATLNITKGELWRVQSHEFLNDTLIEWGLKHLMSELQGQGSHVHLFNSFFYSKISSKDRDKRMQAGMDGQPDRWPAYETVRKWTKSVDVFSKKFIIVPINEDYHWYLAIIYNPAGMLLNAPAELKEPLASAEASGGKTPDSLDENSVDAQLDTAPSVSNLTIHDETINIPDTEDQMEVDLQSDHGDVPHEGDESIDPIDCLPPRGDIKDFRIGSEEPVRRIRPAPRPGREIESATLVAYKKQDEPSPFPTGKSKAEPKKAERIPDHNILNSDKTWIITFDSLGSQHRAVGRYLEDWLRWEARSKKGEQYGSVGAEYTHAQVPLQTNFSDCGLYLVHYASRLLKDPETILKLVERRLPHKGSEERKQFDSDVDRIWGISQNHNLREEWQATINSLTEQYQAIKANEEKEEKDKSPAEGAEEDEAVEEEDSGEGFLEVQIEAGVGNEGVGPGDAENTIEGAPATAPSMDEIIAEPSPGPRDTRTPEQQLLEGEGKPYDETNARTRPAAHDHEDARCETLIQASGHDAIQGPDHGRPCQNPPAVVTTPYTEAQASANYVDDDVDVEADDDVRQSEALSSEVSETSASTAGREALATHGDVDPDLIEGTGEDELDPALDDHDIQRIPSPRSRLIHNSQLRHAYNPDHEDAASLAKMAYGVTRDDAIDVETTDDEAEDKSGTNHAGPASEPHAEIHSFAETPAQSQSSGDDRSDFRLLVPNSAQRRRQQRQKAASVHVPGNCDTAATNEARGLEMQENITSEPGSEVHDRNRVLVSLDDEPPPLRSPAREARPTNLAINAMPLSNSPTIRSPAPARQSSSPPQEFVGVTTGLAPGPVPENEVQTQDELESDEEPVQHGPIVEATVHQEVTAADESTHKEPIGGKHIKTPLEQEAAEEIDASERPVEEEIYEVKFIQQQTVEKVSQNRQESIEASILPLSRSSIDASLEPPGPATTDLQAADSPMAESFEIEPEEPLQRSRKRNASPVVHEPVVTRSSGRIAAPPSADSIQPLQEGIRRSPRKRDPSPRDTPGPSRRPFAGSSTSGSIHVVSEGSASPPPDPIGRKHVFNQTKARAGKPSPKTFGKGKNKARASDSHSTHTHPFFSGSTIPTSSDNKTAESSTKTRNGGNGSIKKRQESLPSTKGSAKKKKLNINTPEPSPRPARTLSARGKIGRANGSRGQGDSSQGPIEVDSD